MTGTDVAVYESQSGTLALSGDQIEWSPVQQAALAHIGIDTAPQPDQQVFMHVCQRTGLDPFARQIYMIPRQEGSGQDRKTRWTIQTGIDGFRLIAERHPQYRGQIGPQWCGPDGAWLDVWLDPNKPPVAARVGVLRGDREGPIWGVALFREYAQTKTWNGQTSLTKMWREKGAHMVAKCAEALGLRKAFPAELSGLMTDDEMTRTAPTSDAREVQQSPAVTAAELTGAVVVDADPVDDAAAADEEPPPADEPRANQEQMKKLFAALRESDIGDRHVWATEVLGDRIKSFSELTVSQASRLIDRLERGPAPVSAADEEMLAEQMAMEAELAAAEGDTAGES